jgi:membrane protease YdiL (CAAX protease family)
MTADGDERPDVDPLPVGLAVEGALAVIALVLSSLGLYDHRQPLTDVDSRILKTAAVWGGLGTLPLLAYLAAVHLFPTGLLRSINEFVDVHMKPLFRESTIIELLSLSVMAGICEELLFRWCIQGGIQSAVNGLNGVALGLTFSSVAFGLCHWVNRTYAIVATIIGFYLGGLMILTGTFLAPAIAHAAFDFLALIYITRRPLTEQK